MAIDLGTTIQRFGIEYYSDNIVIKNDGNSDLFILDITCSQLNFLSGIDLISENINGSTITVHNTNLGDQFPKSIAVNDSITVKFNSC